MLITRSPFSEEQTHLLEATSPSDALLKQLNVLLDDDELLEQVRADASATLPTQDQAWTALDAGGGDPPHARAQRPLQLELSADGSPGLSHSDAMLVLSDRSFARA